MSEAKGTDPTTGPPTVSSLDAMFNALDTDGDGVITRAELHGGIYLLGVGLSDVEIDRLLNVEGAGREGAAGGRLYDRTDFRSLFQPKQRRVLSEDDRSSSGGSSGGSGGAGPLSSSTRVGGAGATARPRAGSDAALVEAANELLAALSISNKPIHNVGELQANASSMFVAIFEKVFACRIRSIRRRRPLSRHDYEYNANLVINALRSKVRDVRALDGITGKTLCDERSSSASIGQLVDVFATELQGTSFYYRRAARGGGKGRYQAGGCGCCLSRHARVRMQLIGFPYSPQKTLVPQLFLRPPPSASCPVSPSIPPYTHRFHHLYSGRRGYPEPIASTTRREGAQATGSARAREAVGPSRCFGNYQPSHRSPCCAASAKRRRRRRAISAPQASGSKRWRWEWSQCSGRTGVGVRNEGLRQSARFGTAHQRCQYVFVALSHACQCGRPDNIPVHALRLFYVVSNCALVFSCHVMLAFLASHERSWTLRV